MGLEEGADHGIDDGNGGDLHQQSERDAPAKPRQWLIDRVFGKSPPSESKPPCWICYVPPFITIAPDLLEQNCFCECIGKIGVIDPDESVWRKRLMRAAIFFNFAAFSLAITSCLAISQKFHILRKVQFSKGHAAVTNLTSGEPLDWLTADVDIGLQAIAYSDNLGQEVISFNEFCDYNGTGLELVILPEDCSACAEVSDSLIFTLAVSAIPYIPAMLTNVIRSYSNYDINCMKTFSTLPSAISMALGLYSFLAYRFECFFTFREGDVYFAKNLTEVPKDSEDAVGKITVSWSPGSGLICIILATALIGLDILFHLAVPSPSIARDHEKQAEYERLSTSGVTMEASPAAFVRAFINMIRGKKKTLDKESEQESREIDA